jgi:peptidoglycan hydrolase-like protein with peptidoglycan-binding domain
MFSPSNSAKVSFWSFRATCTQTISVLFWTGVIIQFILCDAMKGKIIIGVAAALAAIASPMLAAASGPCVDIGRTLKLGSVGDDVRALQVFLNANSNTRVAETGPGSAGRETTVFGKATRAAVIKFQELRREEILAPAGLSRGTGVVGQMTRAVLRKECASDIGSSRASSSSLIQTSKNTSAHSSAGTPASAVPLLSPILPDSSQGEPRSTTGTFAPTVVTNPWMGAAQTQGAPFILMTNDQVVSRGKTLTLYGTGFTNQTPNTVRIGNYTISNVGVDQNGLITIRIPSDAPLGRQYLSVTNANGSSNTDVFIVIPTPGVQGPVAKFGSPGRGKVGTTVTVYGSGFSKTWNDIHFPTAIVRGVKSADGTTLTFTVPAPEVDMTSEELAAAPDISSTYYIINDYGISDGVPFTVQFH